MKKGIGGYFELDCLGGNQYHKNAIKLNSARYSIQYILNIKKYKKIYIPYYIGDSVLQPANNLDIEIEFYNIDNNLMPIIEDKLKDNEVLLFVNYFGLNTNKIAYIGKKYKNVIIDNTQAFYVKAILNLDTVYSPRKFFGVSDGGYLYIDSNKKLNLEKDISYNRYKYLLKRTDLGSEAGYKDYLENEDELSNQSIMGMSDLTSAILAGIDYNHIKNTRSNNFKILHDTLKSINELKIEESHVDDGAMVYPLLLKHDSIRHYLIENKIYVATYWNDALKRVSDDSFEAYLTKYLLPLPIDQRYGRDEMEYIIKKVMEAIKK